MSLKVVTWNVQWATPKSQRTPEILARIDGHAPDVVCLTEVNDTLLSKDGFTISAQPDYGYTIKEGRRKVVLWSRHPWAQVDVVGSDTLPPGRFVSGVTRTPAGDVTVLGICIPWFGCRTEAYREERRKARWEDHETYLAGLTEIMKQLPANRLIGMGDFNQVVGPGARAPRKLQTALQQAFPAGMTLVTTETAFQGRKSIDHIVLSNDLAAESPHPISNYHQGTRLSDHFGVAATVTAQRE